MTFNLDQALFRVRRWEEMGDHEAIIEHLGAEPIESLGTELTTALAQAHIDSTRGQIGRQRDDRQERLDYAERLLFAVEEEGLSSAKWCHAMGETLFFQDREREALPYAERAVDLDPRNNESRDLQHSCAEYIERQTVVKPVTMSRIAAYYEDKGWKFSLNEDGVFKSGFKNCVQVYHKKDNTFLILRAIWRPNLPVELLPHAIEQCNDWNANRLIPKVYAEEAKEGEVWVFAENNVLIEKGMTQHLLDTNIRWFMNTADLFFEKLADAFPSAVDYEDGYEDGDADGEE